MPYPAVDPLLIKLTRGGVGGVFNGVPRPLGNQTCWGGVLSLLCARTTLITLLVEAASSVPSCHYLVRPLRRLMQHCTGDAALNPQQAVRAATELAAAFELDGPVAAPVSAAGAAAAPTCAPDVQRDIGDALSKMVERLRRFSALRALVNSTFGVNTNGEGVAPTARRYIYFADGAAHATSCTYFTGDDSSPHPYPWDPVPIIPGYALDGDATLQPWRAAGLKFKGRNDPPTQGTIWRSAGSPMPGSSVDLASALNKTWNNFNIAGSPCVDANCGRMTKSASVTVLNPDALPGVLAFNVHRSSAKQVAVAPPVLQAVAADGKVLATYDLESVALRAGGVQAAGDGYADVSGGHYTAAVVLPAAPVSGHSRAPVLGDLKGRIFDDALAGNHHLVSTILVRDTVKRTGTLFIYALRHK